MKKLLVVTTGDFMLVDVNVRPPQEIQPDRPSVVQNSYLIESRVGKKQLTILADNLPAEANDEDFADAFKSTDGDADLAVAAYLAELGVEVEGETEGEGATEPEEKPAPKKAAPKKPAGK